MSNLSLRGLAPLVLLLCYGAARADPVAVASYAFNNTLNSSTVGAPALVATDPLALSDFGTDIVNGVSQTVFNFAGAATPLTDQAGLTLDTTGLLTSNSVYSLELVFKFTQKVGAWRRIVDVSSRQSDSGFYVDPTTISTSTRLAAAAHSPTTAITTFFW